MAAGPLLTHVTLGDGRIEVIPADAAPNVPLLHLAQHQSTLRSIVARFGPLMKKNEARTGVPFWWLAGLAFSLSGGEPSVAREGRVGLLQVRFAPGGSGYAEEELLTPELNVRAGADLIAKFMAFSRELPEVTSMYLSGPEVVTTGRGVGLRARPSDKPWGVEEPWPGVIWKTVAASNTVLHILRQTTEPAQPAIRVDWDEEPPTKRELPPSRAEPASPRKKR